MTDSIIVCAGACGTAATAVAPFTRSMSRKQIPVAQISSARERTKQRALTEYREHVRSTAKARRKALVNNSSPEHFEIVMVELFCLATREVKIYSNHLSRCTHVEHRKLSAEDLGLPVWASDEIIVAADEFLAKTDTRIDIIVRNALDADEGDLRTHPFLKAMVENEHRAGTVTIRVANAEANPSLDMFPQDFVVVDERAYRHELNGDAIRAAVQFADDGTGELLARSFRSMAKNIDALSDGESPSTLAFYYPPHCRSLGAPALIRDDIDPNSEDRGAPLVLSADGRTAMAYPVL